MAEVAARPVLFLDFDNTITVGDVLDRLIERFSPSRDWQRWEADWQAGRMGTVECLTRQMEGVRASREDLMDFVATVEIDPAFIPLVHWAQGRGIEVVIVSDNFAPLIAAILRQHRAPHIPVLANGLDFAGDRVKARFPLSDPACARCAHCKAQHLRRTSGHTRVYVGDGLSDLCPALIADVVFAKDSLARALRQRGAAFHPFASLADVARSLQARIDSPVVA